MAFHDNTIQIDGTGKIFENLGKLFPEAGKKLAKIVIKCPARALEESIVVQTYLEITKQLYLQF